MGRTLRHVLVVIAILPPSSASLAQEAGLTAPRLAASDGRSLQFSVVGALAAPTCNSAVQAPVDRTSGHISLRALDYKRLVNSPSEGRRQEQQRADAETWRALAEKLVKGDLVTVKLKSGETVKGSLTDKTADAILVLPGSHIGARTLRFDAIESITVDHTTSTSVNLPAGKKRSPGSKWAGGAVGAAGGFFAGGYLGSQIEGNSCHCDDPGLIGGLVGASIGAVIGGIVGAHFLF